MVRCQLVSLVGGRRSAQRWSAGISSLFTSCTHPNVSQNLPLQKSKYVSKTLHVKDRLECGPTWCLLQRCTEARVLLRCHLTKETELILGNVSSLLVQINSPCSIPRSKRP